MSRSQYPPNFSGKKTVKIKIRYLALKNILFFSARYFLGSVLGVNFWKIQRGGGFIGKIPSVGGMDIFWNYILLVTELTIIILFVHSHFFDFLPLIFYVVLTLTV